MPSLRLTYQGEYVLTAHAPTIGHMPERLQDLEKPHTAILEFLNDKAPLVYTSDHIGRTQVRIWYQLPGASSNAQPHVQRLRQVRSSS